MSKKPKQQASSEPRRHLIVPDTQTRPGVPLDHLDWIGQAIVDYRPDVVVHLGDHWDMESLNSHEQPGSAPLEGKRFLDDIYVGNEAFARISLPMEKCKGYAPRCEFIMGNHETRADRVATNNPKLTGVVGSHLCDTREWHRNEFLERVWLDGICYSHYFTSSHSDRPVGGEVSNRLNKIGASFVQGHEQGFRYGTKIIGAGYTWHGLVCGSAYLHIEDYRGAQGQRHWRGIVILNEVEDGEYDIMPLSLKYLCKKYTGDKLHHYMKLRYPRQNWDHLK